MKRSIGFAVLALAVASCRWAPQGGNAGSTGAAVAQMANPSAPAYARGTEILWDSFGVPHVNAKSMLGIGYGFGWAQAHNHGDLLLRLYGQARGRSAEYWGGNANLAEDRWVRTVGGVKLGESGYAALKPQYRAYLDAFAAGINDYARTHRDRIADSVEVVLPVTGADVMSHSARVLYSFFLSSRQRATDAGTRWTERGSNAWAIAPSRSASGKAMLVQNPHLPWADAFTWIEAQLSGDGADVYGAGLVGSPVINIGFNDRLGWTHTVNTTDTEDYYELTLADGGYTLDGTARRFETDTAVIRIKRADGTLGTETLVVRRSVHGPVLSEKNGKALAVRIAGLDRMNGVEQWWLMGRARNLADFERALSMLQITGQNTTYADADGHILYFYGNVPARASGDVASWAGVVRGDSSSLVWNGVLPYQATPKVLDPPTGFVQNANDPPWVSTYPVALDPSKYPAHVAPRVLPLRPQRSLRMLLGDSSITFDELLAYKHSTRLELADRVLDALLGAARVQATGECNNGTASGRCEAVRVLSTWDRSTDATSRGAVLFIEWWDTYARAMAARSPYAVRWTANDPLGTPRGISDTLVALTALDSAAARVKTRWQDVAVPWGSVYRLRRDTLDVPGNGASGAYGAFRVANATRLSDGRSVISGGDSYVGVLEFTSPLRARTLVGYGNASQPGSPHRTDQLGLFARKELRTAWRTPAEIMANLERRERF
jgi:acyl-homoserine-lactone acylase